MIRVTVRFRLRVYLTQASSRRHVTIYDLNDNFTVEYVNDWYTVKCACEVFERCFSSYLLTDELTVPLKN